MTCPHCGAKNVPDNSRMCPLCGQVLVERPAGTVEHRPAAADVERKKPYLLAGVLGAIILILIVALIVALRPKNPVTAGPTVPPPPPGAPVTQAPPAPNPPTPGAPVTSAPAAQAPTVKLPAEDPNKKAIEAYLQRVAYIEKQRQQVVNNLEPALLEAQILQSGMGDTGMLKELLEPDPDAFAKAQDEAKSAKPNEVQQLINSYVGQLRTLDQQLRAIQPVPRPAFDFARAYDNAFGSYARAMIQIGQIMNQGLADPSKAASTAGQLNGMKGSFASDAKGGLDAADQQLTALCQKYGIQKPFAVTDTPSGAVTGLG